MTSILDKDGDDSLERTITWENLAIVDPKWAEDIDQLILKEMGNRISEEINKEWGKQVRFVAYCIIMELVEIPDPNPG